MAGDPSNIGARLLERERELGFLENARRAASAGQGCLVFVEGEAGVGKSALVQAFTAREPSGAVLVGVCDSLDTPRPLGPLLDMVPGLGADFPGRIAASASSPELFTAVVERLASMPPATILIFEDIHWADQATLDLLRFLGRRIQRLRVLAIATLREDAAAQVITVLGDLATASGVQRLRLAPLSQAGTAELAKDSALDPRPTLQTHGRQSILHQAGAYGGRR